MKFLERHFKGAAIRFILAVLTVILTPNGMVAAQALDTPILDVAQFCPKHFKTCVNMSANLKRPPIGDGPDILPDFVTEVKPSGKDMDLEYRDVLILVRGRLKGGEEGYFRLKESYPADALNCNDFFMPVIGLRGRNGATILTRQGIFEILSDELEFGSVGSLSVFDIGRAERKSYLSPAWEMHGLALEPVILSNGKVLWHKGERCLNIKTNGAFVALDPKECKGVETQEANDNEKGQIMKLFGIGQEAENLEHTLFSRIKSTKKFIGIYYVACT
jgi:hypothetical protein